jgi:hypothetical protein
MRFLARQISKFSHRALCHVSTSQWQDSAFYSLLQGIFRLSKTQKLFWRDSAGSGTRVAIFGFGGCGRKFSDRIKLYSGAGGSIQI